ncbi:helix-turn-helix transcriptional regulator [Comamonas sp.]|uniref:helix-turn-helix transcriptional regulator n=1 Tax=Comamonas sp. TaxID=34028 RepID=UPI003A9250B2
MAAAHIPMALQELVPDLIASIYEAALEPARWQSVLQKLGTALRSPASVIWANDFAQKTVDMEGSFGSFGASCGFDAAELTSFAQHYCQCNVWLQDPSLHSPGTVVNSSQLFPDQRLTSTEWFGDWLQPQGLFYSCAAVVENQHERSFNVTMVRSHAAGAYEPQELQLMQQLMPHLQTAFAIHRRLYKSQALVHASLAVLEDLPLGVLLVDEHARLLHGNSRATGLMERSQLLMRAGGERLRASNAADDRWLQKAMHECVATGLGKAAHVGRASRFRGLAGQQLQVMVSPLPRQVSPYGVHCAAMVLLSDPALTIPSLQTLLQGLYRLTLAEAQLAQALVNGWTLQEFAERQGLSIHTVRSQYKAAASKVGVGRQADFVRVLLTGPALMRWGHQADPTALSHA